jgi:regulator of nucleoside diphosphate kinase
MVAEVNNNGAANVAVKNRIHITSHDKQLLERLLAQPEAMRLARPDQLQALTAELQRAVIVEPQDVSSDVITMNSRAELLDLDTGEEVTFTLVFPSHANIEQHKISVLAPIGAGMLGYRVGAEFEWNVPGGVRRMRVTKIHYQPEAARQAGHSMLSSP